MADEEFDLFGNPVRRSDGRRGRPAHRYALEIDNKIKLLLARGWSNERIAKRCKISVPTLKKYYFSTLKDRDFQRDALDAWRFEQAFEAAASGNVGGMRLLDQMIQRDDTMMAAARVRDDVEDKPEPVGVKEQARRGARDAIDGASDGWGDDLKPGGGLH